jgi:hypothetical protein
MNQNNLNRAELVDFARNAALQIAAGNVSGLLPAQEAAMAAAIEEAAAELAQADGEQVALAAAGRQAMEIARQKQSAMLKLLQLAKDTLKGIDSPANEFDLLGYDPPVRTRKPVRPKKPNGLAATGYSNGVNVLKFKGNNRPGSVTYVVEARIGDAADWVMIGISKKQTFRHIGFKPGVPVRYRIRAEAARGNFSAYSNEAGIYGE